MKTKFKIKDLGITDKDFLALPFGRRIEYSRKIEAFKQTARHVYISQKRRSHAAAWREFRDLYEPTQWYTQFVDEGRHGGRDDSFQVFFTSDMPAEKLQRVSHPSLAEVEANVPEPSTCPSG